MLLWEALVSNPLSPVGFMTSTDSMVLGIPDFGCDGGEAVN